MTSTALTTRQLVRHCETERDRAIKMDKQQEDRYITNQTKRQQYIVTDREHDKQKLSKSKTVKETLRKKDHKLRAKRQD